MPCLGQLVSWDVICRRYSTRLQNTIGHGRQVALQIRVLGLARPDPKFSVLDSHSSWATISKFERSSSSESVGKFEGDLCRMPPQPAEHCTVGVA
jgi:hypothetical protein